jgi:ssDNA-binding Zn-finger/Zn-ribbon topoisomerase 1
MSIRAKTSSNPSCPRCGGRTRKAGKYRACQAYKCANPDCRKQFAPDIPSGKRKPRSASTRPSTAKHQCKLCGRYMEAYKKRRRTIVLRCGGYKLPGKPCRNRLLLPNPKFTEST